MHFCSRSLKPEGSRVVVNARSAGDIISKQVADINRHLGFSNEPRKFLEDNN